MTRLGLTLNRTKTRLCDARSERFDFLGYTTPRKERLVGTILKTAHP
jgi:hypothetical protein